MWSILFLFAILPLYVLALPMPHGGIHRRNHKLIKMSTKGVLPYINGTHTSGPSSTNGSSSVNGSSSADVPSSSDSPNALALWTTASGVASNAVKLTMDAFTPTASLSRAQPSFSKAPDGSEVLQIHFAKGSYDYKGPPGGISFYAKPMDLSNAKTVVFNYSLYFSEGFDFHKGGKLPGMYGGDDAETAISCSGGRRDTSCWSARFMFRTDGDAELYTYLPQPDSGPQFSGNSQLCDVKPMSNCNDVYGASVARGAWKWATGAWTHISQELTLNSAGKQDGKIKVTANDQLVIDLSGLAFRDSDNGKFQGIQMQSFFGGHDESWASTQDQDIYTKDYSIAVKELKRVLHWASSAPPRSFA